MFVMFGVPQLQLYMSPAMLVLMAVMSVDGLILGRKVSRLVDEKFPSNTESRWKLGFYAARPGVAAAPDADAAAPGQARQQCRLELA